MLTHSETARSSTIVFFPVVPSEPAHRLSAVSSYAIGPIDPSHLLTISAPCSDGDICPLLVPHQMPLWILHHPEFRDGYERNYFTEDEGLNEEWGTVVQTVNLLYTKLRGKGFEECAIGEVAPDFGAWELGWLLREFTRLAHTNRLLAFTALAHLGFLLSFFPPEPSSCWPPVALVWAHWQHDEAVKAFRARVRVHREQGKSYDEAQRLALS